MLDKNNVQRKKIRIMLISSFAPPYGGLTTWSSEYMDSMKKKQVEIDTVNTNYVGAKQIVIGKRNILYECKRSCNIWKRVWKLSDRKQHIVHLCSPCSFMGCLRDMITIGLIRIKNPPVRVILHCHCNLNDYVGRRKRNILVFRLLMKLIDKVFVMNNQSLYFMRSNGYSNIVKIPNCLSEQKSRSDSKVLEIKRDKINILFLGRQTYDKGIDIVIETAKIAYEKNENMFFHIVGDSNSYLEKLLPLPSNVAVYGRKNHGEALQFLSQVDLLLFPSRTEGFPYVILEAMMFAKPVVSSDVGAIKEMLDGTGAIIINEFKGDSYYNAIKRLIDKRERREIGKKEQERYRQLYNPDNVANMIMSEYEKLCKSAENVRKV